MSVVQLIEMGIILAFVGWGLVRVLLRRARLGYFFYFLIAIVALWEGFVLIPTLLNGFVLHRGAGIRGASGDAWYVSGVARA